VKASRSAGTCDEKRTGLTKLHQYRSHGNSLFVLIKQVKQTVSRAS
jgi:hypothetical protein